MLAEIHTVHQETGGLRRRWFSDRKLDLYVWYDDGDNIVQFQICYDKGPDEQALSWQADSGLSNRSVDDGESGVFRMKSSPILTVDSAFNASAVCELFVESGQKLEHDLYEFVLARLQGE